MHKGTKRENITEGLCQENYDPAKFFKQRAITIIHLQYHPSEYRNMICFPKNENSFNLFHDFIILLYQKTIQNTGIRENLDVLVWETKSINGKFPRMWQFFCKTVRFCAKCVWHFFMSLYQLLFQIKYAKLRRMKFFANLLFVFCIPMKMS